MEWRDRAVAVVGLGVSNLAVIRYLADRGARLVGFDQKSEDALGGVVDELRALGVRLALGPDYLDRLDAWWDAVFVTPGMPKDIPVLKTLRARGIPFQSEIGLFFSLCRAPIIGITGSSGKTTTTTLVGEILKAGNRPVFVGGNIGRPLVEIAESIPENAWVVLELSSFQLEMLNTSPHMAVITNVTPNHLDLHGTMEAYVDAKRRIFEFQGSSDVAVFNADDATTRGMMGQAVGRALAFSRRQEQPAGAWLDGDRIVVRTQRGHVGQHGHREHIGRSEQTGQSEYTGQSGCSGHTGHSGRSGHSGQSEQTGQSEYTGRSGHSGHTGRSGHSGHSGRSEHTGQSGCSGHTGQVGPMSAPTVICRIDELQLPGDHNVENVLAAVTVGDVCGIAPDEIRSAVTHFTGVRHRLELVAEWRGIRFYNDSIATSPARAVAGIRAFQEPIVLIAGGYDKQLPFDELAAALPGRVHTVVLLGTTAPKIEQAIIAHTSKTGVAGPAIVHVDSFDDAVEQARRAAVPGDVVLLSPACASYDMFPNFEVRGDRFRQLVAAFEEPRAAAK